MAIDTPIPHTRNVLTVKSRTGQLIPMLPTIRYIHAGWMFLFASACFVGSVSGIGQGSGAVVAPAMFGAYGLWVAQRTWRNGAVITDDTVVLRGFWRTRTFARQDVADVRLEPRRIPVWRHVIGDWADQEVVIYQRGQRVGLGSAGLAFYSEPGGAQFVTRVLSALSLPEL